MKKQSGYSSFPAILLTFSLLLLVLAVGFVVGRVVVARAYLDRAPKFEAQVSTVPEPGETPPEPRELPAGRSYVPPPSPPPASPTEEGSAGQGQDEAGGNSSVGLDAVEEAARQRPERSPDLLEPAPRRESQPAEPRAESQPSPSPPAAESRESTYAIQVGVFTSLQGARGVIDDLARSGYPARISPEKRGTQELYRVVTGRYRSEYAARKALDQLRKEGFEAFLVQE